MVLLCVNVLLQVVDMVMVTLSRNAHVLTGKISNKRLKKKKKTAQTLRSTK